MKTDHSTPPIVSQTNEKIESELFEIQIAAEFAAWDAASDEALENFEKGLE